MKLKNKVQLIVYPDSFGKNIKELNEILNKYFKEEIFGVHLLPFFPSSSDRGFSPITYFEVDPGFGTWKDVKKLGKEYYLVCDMIVNHVSSQSRYFKDYLRNGKTSRYKDFFITAEKFSKRLKKHHINWLEQKNLHIIPEIYSKLRKYDIVFHRNGVNKFDLKKIYRRRPGPLFIKFKLPDKSSTSLCCTFSPDQIDFDVKNKTVKKMFKETFKVFAKNEISMVRLDAVAYVGKKRGTSNFFIDETFDFIKWLSKVGHKNEIEILPEVHTHYRVQHKLSESSGVDYVYDFSLPVIVLHALHTWEGDKIREWIKIRPGKTINVLDTHDGIDMTDVEDLLTKKEINRVIDKIFSNSENGAKHASGTSSGNVDVYQVNCTYYSALNEKDNAYIVARVIQLFLPGIPQIYYVGLLAGKNDIKRLYETGRGREIMRHNYNEKEIEKSLEKNVVKRLLKLIRFRNSYKAFNGRFSVLDSKKYYLKLRWVKGKYFCEAQINLKTKVTKLKYYDVLNDKIVTEKI